MSRTRDILSKVYRNLKRYGIDTNDLQDQEIFDELVLAQDRIISDHFSDKIVKIIFVEGQDTYPLSTDNGETIERKNIASVKIIKLPSGWTFNSTQDFGNVNMFPRGFEVISNARFVDIINANPDIIGKPLVGTIINSELKVYPVPTEDEVGKEIELYVYLSSSAGVINDENEPELPNFYDKSLELFATAQFLSSKERGELLNEFSAEANRVRPIINRKHHNLYKPPITGWT